MEVTKLNVTWSNKDTTITVSLRASHRGVIYSLNDKDLKGEPDQSFFKALLYYKDITNLSATVFDSSEDSLLETSIKLTDWAWQRKQVHERDREIAHLQGGKTEGEEDDDEDTWWNDTYWELVTLWYSHWKDSTISNLRAACKSLRAAKEIADYLAKEPEAQCSILMTPLTSQNIKRLPCGHFFSKEALRKLCESKRGAMCIACPMCREQVSIDSLYDDLYTDNL